MMITANENLLNQMEKVAKDIYSEVVSYFSSDIVKENLKAIAKELADNEVIYDFDAVFDRYFKDNIDFVKESEKNA